MKVVPICPRPQLTDLSKSHPCSVLLAPQEDRENQKKSPSQEDVNKKQGRRGELEYEDFYNWFLIWIGKCRFRSYLYFYGHWDPT